MRKSTHTLQHLGNLVEKQGPTPQKNTKRKQNVKKHNTNELWVIYFLIVTQL